MEQSSLFMAPMARKKRVMVKNSPNSYRVISEQAEATPFHRSVPALSSKSDSNILGQRDLCVRSPLDSRHNRPNPNTVGFLRQDVRLLNEPVCNVLTSGVKEHQWWPTHYQETVSHKAPYSLDTTMRHDFQYTRGVKGSARHTSNTDIKAAFGAVPVNNLREPDGRQRFWNEHISYEHQYNSRTDPNYPIRAKRHGSFVVTRVQPPFETTTADLPPIAS